MSSIKSLNVDQDVHDVSERPLEFVNQDVWNWKPVLEADCMQELMQKRDHHIAWRLVCADLNQPILFRTQPAAIIMLMVG